MTEPFTAPIKSLVDWLVQLAPHQSVWQLENVIRGGLAILIVSLIAGSVGSLVVSNRMAFFSDALAHCTFAGAAFGLLIALILGTDDEGFRHWINFISLVFGVVIGLLIAYVHETSSLPSDTVIGVFFAGALGLGAIFAKVVRNRQIFNLESFIFGNPYNVVELDLLYLILLLLLTTVFLIFCYNPLVFGSFNSSLARSRRLPERLSRYLFIVLLSVIVNLCQQTVGVLLINGLLIVPAATACNISSNLRQLLWRSIAIAFGCGMVGLIVSLEVSIYLASRRAGVEIGIGGTVLVLCVVMFALSMALGKVLKRSGGASGN